MTEKKKAPRGEEKKAIPSKLSQPQKPTVPKKQANRAVSSTGVKTGKEKLASSSHGSIAKRKDPIEVPSLRKKREKELSRMNRTLRALSNSSQAIIRAKNETEFMNEVCQIIIRDCGHAMVWIGMAQNDVEKSVRPVASAGFEEGYLDTLHITWAYKERGRGPTGTAIRTGHVVHCRNMLTDPKFAPWRSEALKRGYSSSIALPLKANGKTFGTITIYSKDPDSFTDKEVNLLKELADDFAFGITTLRDRSQKARAEAALAESEKRYRHLVEMAPDGIVVYRGGLILYMNTEGLKMLGVETFEQLNHHTIRDLIHQNSLEELNPLRKKTPIGEIDYVREAHLYKMTGEPLDVEILASPVEYQGGPATQAIVRDITERKKAEETQAWLASFPMLNPQPIIELDETFSVKFINPAAKLLMPDLEEKGKEHIWLKGLDKKINESKQKGEHNAVREIHLGDSVYYQNIQYELESQRIRIYGTDITARVRAEEAHDRLAIVLENTPDMVVTFTPEGTLVYANLSARRILGISGEADYSNWNIAKGMPDWAVQMVLEIGIPEALRAGVWTGETVFHDKEGRDIPVSQVIIAHPPQKDETVYLSTVARDLTSRKQVEDALIQAGVELEQRVQQRTWELNESNERLRQETEERQRLADSLHDAVNQSLFSAGLIAEVLPRLWERDQPEARKSLQDLRRLTRGAQAEMRALLNELRPSMIKDNNLGYLLDLLAQTFSGRTNIPVSLSIQKEITLPDEVKMAYYRVCQEALNNVVKHAKASQVQIRLTQINGITDLQISDNGCGFNLDDANASHYGLGMIKERVGSIHGQLTIDSKPGKGCMIHIRWTEEPAEEEE